MIVTSDINAYSNTPAAVGARINQPGFDTEADGQTGTGQQSADADTSGSKQTSSKVITEPDGSTVMQYTNILPSGSIMRKNVTLHQADAFASDPLNPSPMLRRRSDVYESMMQIF